MEWFVNHGLSLLLWFAIGFFLTAAWHLFRSLVSKPRIQSPAKGD